MARNLALSSFLDTCRRERLKRTPLVSGGRFDRSAIMREAVKIARSMRPSSLTWRECMSIGLGSAWKQARAEMAKACAAEPFPIREVASVPAFPRNRGEFRPPTALAPSPGAPAPPRMAGEPAILNRVA